jgi:hypothetical protein
MPWETPLPINHKHLKELRCVGPVQMVANTEMGIRFLIDVKVSTTRVTRFGYDLPVRQVWACVVEVPAV